MILWKINTIITLIKMEKYFFLKIVKSFVFQCRKKQYPHVIGSVLSLLLLTLPRQPFPEPFLFCDINCSIYCSVMFN